MGEAFFAEIKVHSEGGKLPKRFFNGEVGKVGKEEAHSYKQIIKGPCAQEPPKGKGFHLGRRRGGFFPVSKGSSGDEKAT